MAEHIVQVKSNEFYRPVHDKTIENWEKIGKKYEYTAQENTEAKQWDFYRYQDDTYRFNVKLINLTRILDERYDTEHLLRSWEISGKSEIGNESPFIKSQNLDTYKVPLYETKVVPSQGNQSLKTVAGDITGIDMRYVTPFNTSNVLEAFKDSQPENNLRYVNLNVSTHLGKNSLGLEKKYLLAWLLAPIEFLIEYNKTGNKALVEIDINNIPEEYQEKITDEQIKIVDKIIKDSNIKLLEQLQSKQLNEEKEKMGQIGITDQSPNKISKVKETKKEDPLIVSKRENY
jgi:hypothetical protein